VSISARVAAVVQLVRVGTPELVRRAISGEMSGEQVWTAFKGAAECTKAMAAGDVAADVVADARVASCDACSSCVRVAKLPGVEAMYCGLPLTGNGEGTGTCGCLVGMTVHGRVVPACASMVGSQECGQRRWPT